MKKLLVAGFVLFALSAGAQKKTTVKTTTTKKTASSRSASPLKNLTDSASYAIGLSVANFYQQQGFKNLNTNLIAKAINDVQSNGKALMNESEANEAIMFYINPNLRTNIEAGRDFLAANKKKAGVKTTASGLQYEVIKDAQGPKPLATDTVVVNYAGRLINGFEFDASRGTPIQFLLSRVIKGWTEGLQLMPVGSKYRLFIPHNLAYGPNDNGQIPGGSTLIFEVELLSIKK